MDKLPSGTKLGVARLMRDLERTILESPSGDARNLLADCRTTIALLWSAIPKEMK